MSFVKGQGVIEAGEDKVKIFSKVVTSQTEAVAFSDSDLVGELTDISGMGAQRETKELNGYHYDEAVKILGNSTPNDVSFTENLTKDALSTRKEQYKNKSMLATGIFDSSKSLLYGCVGYISQWGATIPNGDTCQLTYTMAIRTEREDLTLSTSEVG